MLNQRRKRGLTVFKRESCAIAFGTDRKKTEAMNLSVLILKDPFKLISLINFFSRGK